MRAKPKKQPRWQSFVSTITATLVMVAFFTGAGFFVWCGVYAGSLGLEYYHKHHPEHVDATPGELVDKAMAMPGAIVISPHRDLIDMGLARITSNPNDCHLTIKTGSPAIAIKTFHNWCVWTLGAKEILHYSDDKTCSDVKANGNENTFIGSGENYQLGYDAFVECVTNGNTIDPSADFGAVCDGKHDTTRAMLLASNAAASIGGTVLMPDNCAVHNLEAPTTINIVGGRMEFNKGLKMPSYRHRKPKMCQEGINATVDECIPHCEAEVCTKGQAYITLDGRDTRCTCY